MIKKSVILMIVFALAISCFAFPTMAMADDNATDSEQAAVKTSITLKAQAVRYDRVKLTWNKAADVTNQEVYYSINKGIKWKKSKAALTKAGKSMKCTLKDLPTGVKVQAKIKVKYQDNTSAESNIASATTVLAKPQIRCIIKGSKVCKIKWEKVPGAKKYRVYRRAVGKTQFKKIGVTNKKYWLSKKLKPGKKYEYKVTAVRTTKISASSKVLTVSSTANATTVTAKKTSAIKAMAQPKKLKKSDPGYKWTNSYKMLKVAKSKVGYPYVSGAAGPNAFDCSGFVYWVNKKAGVSGQSFTRGSAWDEWNQLKKYSIGRSYSKAQPMDIVFIGSSKSNITHVAFYYGNYKLIHATNPRCGVAITSIYWSGGPGRVVDIVRLPNM